MISTIIIADASHVCFDLDLRIKLSLEALQLRPPSQEGSKIVTICLAAEVLSFFRHRATY